MDLVARQDGLDEPTGLLQICPHRPVVRLRRQAALQGQHEQAVGDPAGEPDAARVVVVGVQRVVVAGESRERLDVLLRERQRATRFLTNLSTHTSVPLDSMVKRH